MPYGFTQPPSSRPEGSAAIPGRAAFVLGAGFSERFGTTTTLTRSGRLLIQK
jgi:hypothetical protein